MVRPACMPPRIASDRDRSRRHTIAYAKLRIAGEDIARRAEVLATCKSQALGIVADGISINNQRRGKITGFNTHHTVLNYTVGNMRRSKTYLHALIAIPNLRVLEVIIIVAQADPAPNALRQNIRQRSKNNWFIRGPDGSDCT